MQAFFTSSLILNNVVVSVVVVRGVLRLAL